MSIRHHRSRVATHVIVPAIAALSLSPLSLPALAASTASMSISDSVSAAVGSASDSVRRSSESSDRKERAAAGDYRIVAIAALPERPGIARLTLQPETAVDDVLLLDLPLATVTQAALQPGQRVTATHREYGVEFARAVAAATTTSPTPSPTPTTAATAPTTTAAEPTPAASRQAFFLVLDDPWFRELQSRPVRL